MWCMYKEEVWLGKRDLLALDDIVDERVCAACLAKRIRST